MPYLWRQGSVPEPLPSPANSSSASALSEQRCHDHPIEKKQEEYNSIAAFFGHLRKKKARRGATTFNYYVDFEKQFETPGNKTGDLSLLILLPPALRV